MEEKKKILIVDDEPDVLDFLSSILDRNDFDVVSAANGTKAIELATTLKPALIILDIVLPDIDGGDVAAALEKNPDTENIPIIFLTGMIEKKEEFPERKTGGRYVVAKPVTADELLAVIKKVLPPQPQPQP